jgi:hypothetical protein
MYDVDYETKDYGNAIKTIEKLTFWPKFKEDLTSLYMSTSQFDKALQLINELNESSGSQIEGNLIKCRFYPKENIRMQKFNLIDQIKSIPKRSRITFRWFICIQK